MTLYETLLKAASQEDVKVAYIKEQDAYRVRPDCHSKLPQ